MSVYLCGETGIINRGCEAIIRSTVKLLDLRSGDIYLATSAPEMDMALTKELGINLIKYNGFPTKYHRYYAAIMRRIKHSVDGKFLQAELFSHLTSDDLCLNIGGDTYCYDRPSRSIELNNFTAKKGIKNVLWCCSIEAEVMHGEILADLKKYKYIFAREKLTYDNLLKAGVDKSRVVKCCDPAFFLEKKQVELPTGFVKGNTVGINVSELIISEKYPDAYSSIVSLMQEILDRTDMSICLIPHVYSIEKELCDWPILNRIYEDINSERVCIVDKEYSCEELKYIISKCRFLIAARTHASIAAYSSEIPTLVLGYSIKSKGIAQDLFGTDEHYVLSNKDITSDKISEDFWFIYRNEQFIHSKLHEYLPEYKNQLLTALDKLRPFFSNNQPICDHLLCTGCQACKSICPTSCISMCLNDNGFYYPQIDTEKCISCGKCKKECPVANRYKDDNKEPICYTSINKNDEVRTNSSSGGVFFELANYVIDNSGVVFGAIFDECMDVAISSCTTQEELKKACGSKYVQANINGAYEQVKDYLNLGKMVLYSGTPCQIAGLYAYLGEKYENLITVDTVCHGVPSPKAWSEYKSSIVKRYGADIENVNFCCKDTGWQSYSLKFKLKNGEIISKKVTDDIYMHMFISHLIMRPSCYICSFRQKHRQSDITLGDFWGVKKWNDSINDDKGISILLIHSEKGEKLFDSVQKRFDVESIEFKDAITDNASFLQSSDPSPYQHIFGEKWLKQSFYETAKLFCGNGRVSQNYRKIKLITNWKWK